MDETANVVDIGSVVSDGLDTGLDMATKAFNWIVGNPLASFMLGLGFTYTAFSLIKRGIRTVKRM